MVNAEGIGGMLTAFLQVIVGNSEAYLSASWQPLEWPQLFKLSLE